MGTPTDFSESGIVAQWLRSVQWFLSCVLILHHIENFFLGGRFVLLGALTLYNMAFVAE